jgi:uncharacterized protein YprB with RNaseH-like and TPR domain
MQRILVFDIEATDLEASFGHVLCIGYKWLGQRRVSVARLQDFPAITNPAEEPDTHLVRAFHEIIVNQADILVTFYGKEFDWKFLNTRMLLAGCTPMPPLSREHVDLYYTCRGNLKMHSNRLQAVSETLGCPLEKTPVRADIWRRASRGHQPSVAYVVEHCKRDVLILEWTYLKLRGFIRQHPWVGRRDSCRTCGEQRIAYRGFWTSATGIKHQRYQCLTCGRWGHVKEAAGGKDQ